ncbi:beta-nerve growth factor isoform 3-T10 [Morphnus guianensis]
MSRVQPYSISLRNSEPRNSIMGDIQSPSGTQNKQLPDSATQSNWPDGMLQPTPAQRLDEIKTLLGEQFLVQYTQRCIA